MGRKELDMTERPSTAHQCMRIPVVSHLFIYLLATPCSKGTLVPQPGIKPMTSTLGGQSPSHWTTSKVP